MNKTNVLVVGSGPAGYTAAVYTARASLEPVVFTGTENGGQLMYTTDVENFPGFPDGVMGPELMTSFRSQSERFGAKIKDELITAVDFSERPFKVWTDLPEGVTTDQFLQSKQDQLSEYIKQIKSQHSHTWEAKSIILSTGATSILIGVPGEADFKGKGVSTCAVCDAAFFREKKVFVFGGGDSAMEDALALAKFTSDVTVVHRRDSFRASKVMQERVLNHPNIKILWNSNLKEVIGEQVVQKVKIDVDGEEKEFDASGVFLAIGHRPVTGLFAGQIDLDGHGYITTRLSLTKGGVDQAQASLSDSGLVSFPSMTSVEGVFAAGDVVDVRYKQAITAAGQGCAAALDAERWLEQQD